MSRRGRYALLSAVAALLVVAALAGWHWWPARAGEGVEIAGIVRTSEIRVAPEISGRLAHYLAEPGQAVPRGQPVAVLTNPELWAAVDAARAQVGKAQSDRDRVYAGVREEQVQALQREVEKAQALHENAVQELARKSVLAANAHASIQELDVARAAEARDLADIAVAEARYAEAQRGPTDEERRLADAAVAAAEAARDVIEARAAKLLLHAPAPGKVAVLAAEIGEAVVPGEPVLTIVPDDGLWFGFNMREDALRELRIGASVPVFSSLDRPVQAKLTELRNWGEFAVWRAARAAGDHDLNTFFVRLDPVGPAPDLAAGQTVWLKLPAAQ
jgi:multidrug resistance efflux pump